MSCGSRTHLAGLEVRGHRPAWTPVGRFAARPRTRRKFEERRVKCESCGGRNRTCVCAVNSRVPVPTQDPPHHDFSNFKLPSSNFQRAPSGSRTHTSAMARQQATATSWARKMHHYQIVKDQRCQSIKSTEPESNPHHLVTTEESCR